jgi:hypothetical protein
VPYNSPNSFEVKQVILMRLNEITVHKTNAQKDKTPYKNFNGKHTFTSTLKAALTAMFEIFDDIALKLLPFLFHTKYFSCNAKTLHIQYIYIHTHTNTFKGIF